MGPTGRKALWQVAGLCAKGYVLIVFPSLYVLLTTLAIQDIPRMPCPWAKYPLLFPALSLQGINSFDHTPGPKARPISCIPPGVMRTSRATCGEIPLPLLPIRHWPTAASPRHTCNPHTPKPAVSVTPHSFVKLKYHCSYYNTEYFF